MFSCSTDEYKSNYIIQSNSNKVLNTDKYHEMVVFDNSILNYLCVFLTVCSNE